MIQTKQAIYNFIVNTFDDYSFNRLKEYDEYNEYYEWKEFESYEEFLLHNKNCIDNLNDNDTIFIHELCNKIRFNKIKTTDEENFITWGASSIYFDTENRLVIMHPR